MVSERKACEAHTVPVRVLTVDDHIPFLRVAHELIDATPGFEFGGEAESGTKALATLEDTKPELALVDVRMPDIDGIEVTRRIKSSRPRTVVVLISALDPTELSGAVAGCGAAALVRKQDLTPALLRQLWREHGEPGP